MRRKTTRGVDACNTTDWCRRDRSGGRGRTYAAASAEAPTGAAKAPAEAPSGMAATTVAALDRCGREAPTGNASAAGWPRARRKQVRPGSGGGSDGRRRAGQMLPGGGGNDRCDGGIRAAGAAGSHAAGAARIWPQRWQQRQCSCRAGHAVPWWRPGRQPRQWPHWTGAAGRHKRHKLVRRVATGAAPAEAAGRCRGQRRQAPRRTAAAGRWRLGGQQRQWPHRTGAAGRHKQHELARRAAAGAAPADAAGRWRQGRQQRPQRPEVGISTVCSMCSTTRRSSCRVVASAKKKEIQLPALKKSKKKRE